MHKAIKESNYAASLNWDYSKGCALCGAPFRERKVGFTSHIAAYRSKNDLLLYCCEEHADFGLAKALYMCEEMEERV